MCVTVTAYTMSSSEDEEL